MPTTYAIPNGRTVMAATIWTSAGGTETISNAVNGVSFQPDFLWMKNRSIVQNHYLVDSNRGTSKVLVSNTTSAETTDATFVTAFNSNGFSLGSGGFGATQAIVGWQWKAGGTAVTNTTGTISSQVSANPTAGFSVVTYTGNATGGATVGHGLGVAPSMMIVKRRESTDDWRVYHISFGATQYMDLNNTTAAATTIVIWNNTAPTSSVFSVGTSNSVNASGGTYVAYCFAPVAGYSAFGSYTGTGSTDGPFVYLGFRPRFLLVKAYSSGSTERGLIWDSSRDTYNIVSSDLVPNTTAAEGGAGAALDFVSNGFKIRSAASSAFNYNGYSYIYMAFAEAPFKYSSAR